jgi:DNA-binding NarL/FixJ family response regulator
MRVTEVGAQRAISLAGTGADDAGVDVQMEVLRSIRANPLTQRLPVVIITHSKQDENITAGYRLGANSFLIKRHDFEEFVKAVQALGTYWLTMNRPAGKAPSPPSAIGAGSAD